VAPWSTTTLAAQAELVRERVDPRREPATAYVGLEHIHAGALTLGQPGDSGKVASACFRHGAGDVLFGRLRPNLRKVVRAPFPGLCTTEAWVLRPRPQVDPDFFFYALANPDFAALCVRSAEGTRMPRARWDYVSSVPLPWPGPAEQRRIAAALAPLDARIALNRRMNQTLQALFRAQFDRVVRPPATGNERWRRVTLDDLAFPHRVTVGPDTVAPDLACIGLAHLDRDRLALERWGRAGDAASPKAALERGDLLFGRLRPGFKKVAIAPVDGLCSTDILVIRPRSPELRALALGWLSHTSFIAHAVSVCTGTRMPRASWSALSAFPVVVPPPEVLERFQASAAPLLQRLVLNVRQDRALAQLRDALLPGLMSGRVRIRPAPAQRESPRRMVPIT